MLIANETINLIIPISTDSKEYVTEYKVVRLENVKMESVDAKRLSELGLEEINGVTLYCIFKYIKAYGENERELQYIKWNLYNSLSDNEKKDYWSINEVNCIITRDEIDTSISYSSVIKNYNSYKIRRITECFSHSKLHHLEITGV